MVSQASSTPSTGASDFRISGSDDSDDDSGLHLGHAGPIDGDSDDDNDEWQLLPASRPRKSMHPLARKSRARLAEMGRAYAENSVGLRDEHEIRYFVMGAVAAGLLDRAKAEGPRPAIWRTFCSVCAAVQGMDETVVNGAQSIYKDQFGIGGDSYRDTWLLGLTNAAPYLWLTGPMNSYFGRRGTIFIACAISAFACIWQAFTHSWWSMFVARFVLGLGIGPKSATAPIFAAECAPKEIRGALTMQWQVWTAFGIMLGYVADLAFLDVPDNGITGVAWRLMMGSAAIPAVIACALVYLGPESPRWYLTKNRHGEAYRAMAKMRASKAERDLEGAKASKIGEMVRHQRNRNALLASEIVMFMQQFSGVNMMAAALLFTGFSFLLPQQTVVQIVCIAAGIYVFGMVYSPGAGPVPFTYSAEAYPLRLRTLGMSVATATTWFFNFVLAVTWPSLQAAFTNVGAFTWYAAWNVVGFFLVLFFVPETKGLTLEELDAVFDVPLRDMVQYGKDQARYWVQSVHGLLAASLALQAATDDYPTAPWRAAFPRLADLRRSTPFFPPALRAGPLLPGPARDLVAAQDAKFAADWGWWSRRAVLVHGLVGGGGEEYGAGEEVYICYGRHSGDFLLAEYGFSPDENAWDEVSLDEVVEPWSRRGRARGPTDPRGAAALGPVPAGCRDGGVLPDAGGATDRVRGGVAGVCGRVGGG
ncbi:unnamed protein product [Parascedosporium putredinis]|uniref:Major facilitator superfamily (MFS) profile domain-containing protein n=1 Tax=Parascedosporium putredinis TaxID=1442378 RepID=A0A9P1H1Z7_9PEZI|nr:unnamed protein product [Parascedosporium putredinis]CAI7994237.1 unnamed protein product [Parascedosporium putredinis]